VLCAVSSFFLWEKRQHMAAKVINDVELQFIYRVAQKNGATLSHCKYSENLMTELRGNW